MTYTSNDLANRVAFLDADHVIKLIPALLAGPGTPLAAYVTDFFHPEHLAEADWRHLIRRLEPLSLVNTSEPGTPEDCGFLVFRRGEIDQDVIQRLPKLKLIQRLGSGAHMIDLDTAGSRGIAVSCITRPSLATVAEHCVMLMLAISRKLLPCDRAVRRAAAPAGSAGSVAYNWAGLDGIESLYGKTLGILGMGEVGVLVAERAIAFGMKVLYCDASPLLAHIEDALGAKRVAKEHLFAHSDVISIHIPGTDDNRGAVGAAEIALMKRTTLLVNTSRGTIIDESALTVALASGQIAGAALDVHNTEPRAADRLTMLPNVVLTPHVAAGSRLTVLRDIEMIFDNFRAVLAGKPVPHGLVSGRSA